MHDDGLPHAGCFFLFLIQSLVQHHTLHVACNDRLLGYLPDVGPGKSLAVAMVVDSDSSKGR